MKPALIENRKRYVFKTVRGFLGKISPRKTEIGTLQGIAEFKDIHKAAIFAEEKGPKVDKAKAEFQRYLFNVNLVLESLGEETLALELVCLDSECGDSPELNPKS
ncbi:hypothetical protein [Niallia endozanthoxylica]|uniref:Uncharacterized protein n=1 Tax=Niallia endozanthoxylica TaxID=2036016 RepID=A0A5J5HN59_9BACI|nr:hypothetical protein [Niallia endozanthoxylica]KAA9022271.1 hypothetical protein F4V44_15475 [Niallia endozanthoxylica]